MLAVHFFVLPNQCAPARRSRIDTAADPCSSCKYHALGTKVSSFRRSQVVLLDDRNSHCVKVAALFRTKSLAVARPPAHATQSALTKLVSRDFLASGTKPVLDAASVFTCTECSCAPSTSPLAPSRQLPTLIRAIFEMRLPHEHSAALLAKDFSQRLTDNALALLPPDPVVRHRSRTLIASTLQRTHVAVVRTVLEVQRLRHHRRLRGMGRAFSMSRPAPLLELQDLWAGRRLPMSCASSG